MMSPARVFVIAEAGVNHNGSEDMALALVDAAGAAGADAVKFQSFRASALISRNAPKAEYQIRTTGRVESQLEMVSKLELSEEVHRRLIDRAARKGVTFLSTPFDLISLRMLTQRFNLETVKIASGEITNAPLLVAIARSSCKAILSTGMTTLSEIEAALGVLAFGYTADPSAVPTQSAFAAAFSSEQGQRKLREQVSLLHCTTEYPAPPAEVNLKAMDTMRAAFGLAVGLSDHTQGIHIPIAAAARGATIVEKHFTLDRKLPGPDHAASLEPDELADMVRAIRDIELALGDGLKRPMPSEVKNRDIARKSLVAARPLAAGERIGPEDIAAKRPGTGLSPYLYWDLLGRPASRDYSEDEQIEL